MTDEALKEPADKASRGDSRPEVPFWSIVPYLLITFAVAWGILGLYIGLTEQMSAWFGELTGQHPLFYLAVYAPALAALIVVLGRSGFGGLRRFLSRVLLWRCSLGWYAFLLFGVPMVFYIGAAIKGTLSEGVGFTSWGAWLSASHSAGTRERVGYGI